MRLGALTQSRISLSFEYWRTTPAGEELVARGTQDVACMRRDGERFVPAPVPESLSNALRPYADT
jgi:enediyne biosynthesis thioesterase